MNPNAADRIQGFRPGAILAVLLAVALLALGGCGQFNDNPGGGNAFTVSIAFGGGSGGATVMDANSTTQGINGPSQGDPVLSVVVGAIVITHPNGSNPDGSFNVNDADNITPTIQDQLEEDVKASLKYLVIEDIPSSSNFVSFPLPPDNLGNWQLVAVGMRHNIDYLSDVADDSPIWYGFSDGFLNGKVGAGGEAPPITLQPWCTGNPYPPDPPGTGGLCP